MNKYQRKSINGNNFIVLIYPHTINLNAVNDGLENMIIIYNILGKVIKIDHVTQAKNLP